MTTQHDPAQAPPKPDFFDAVKSIAQTLSAMPKPEQERALRVVAEHLGIALAGAPLPGVGQPHAPAYAQPGSTPPAAPTRAQDIRSFVQAKQPKSDNQFAAVVAYFYRFEAPAEQRRDSINADCLQEATRQSGRDRLGNPNATLNNAVAQGYLDRAGRGDFTINTVGENLVAMTLPGTGENGGPASRGRGARKKAVKKVAKKTAKKARMSGGG